MDYPKIQWSFMNQGQQVVFRGETPKEVIDQANSEEGKKIIKKVKSTK